MTEIRKRDLFSYILMCWRDSSAIKVYAHNQNAREVDKSNVWLVIGCNNVAIIF